MISIIAAIGKNRELGRQNQLIFRIKEDMQFFRATTTDHPILMGRKTFDSIGRPLPNRTNYVITRHPELLPSGVTPVTNLGKFLQDYTTSNDGLFVIGGSTVYEATLPYATTLYLTEIDASAPNADAFFPTFDKSKYSREIIKKGKENDLAFAIVKYILI